MSYHMPITLEEAAAKFPTLAATSAHPSRSKRYTQISTMDVLQGFVREGFEIRSIVTARTRDESRRGYEKHMIKLRRPQKAIVGDYTPELSLLNSHDGASAYKLVFSMLRFICDNGMAVGENWASVHVPHRGDVASEVINGAHIVLNQTQDIVAQIDRFKSITMSDDAIEAFTHEAFKLRYPDAEEAGRAPITPLMLNHARRPADVGDSVWAVYNRVQENLIKGGFRGRIIGSNGRMRRTTMRPVRGIDQDMTINQRLFTLAESFADNLALAA
jgi:hypothetical protein